MLLKKEKKANERIIHVFGIQFSYKKLRVKPKKIKGVEIEISSFCNRQCWFCPNSIIDRHSKKFLMDEKLYLKILRELKEINYKGRISYSRYNEPLADKELFLTRLKEARTYLPSSLLYTNTNGDYLNAEYLRELYTAGLNSLRIQCYLKTDEEFNHEKIRERIIKKAKDLELEYRFNLETPSRINAVFIYKDMQINMYARDFKINGVNWGG